MEIKDEPQTFALEMEPGSPFWLLYFILSIVVLGGIIGYTLTPPFYLLGYLWLPARQLGEAIMERGIVFLLKIQPWLKADVDIRFSNELRPCLTVSNHRSHLDAFFLLSRIRGVRLFARHTLFWVPFLGLMMRMTRQIRVKRGSILGFVKANEEIKNRLKKGEVVHVFPEMTRCPEGMSGTQEFLLAPFHIAKQMNVPILPIAFKNTDRAWPKGRGGIRYGQFIKVRSLEKLEPSLFPSAESLRDEARRQINLALNTL